MAKHPGIYVATFEHSRYGTVATATAEARNPLAALVRCARNAGLVAHRNPRGSWSYTHRQTLDGMPSCYLLRHCYKVA